MKVTAKIYKGDMPNVNGIVFPKEELQKAVENFNKEKNVVMYGDYPPAINKDGQFLPPGGGPSESHNVCRNL